MIGVAERLAIGARPLAIGLAIGLAALALPRAAPAAGTADPLADGASARERVLAGATAIADPAAALGWNPARLRAAGGLLVHAHFAPLPEGGSLDAFAVARPFGPGVLGGGFMRMGVGGVATFDEDGLPTGTADFGDLELAAGYAVTVPWPFGAPVATPSGADRPIPSDAPTGAASSGAAASGAAAATRPPGTRALDVGAALRLRRQSFGGGASAAGGGGSGTGIGMDVGVALRPRADLALGLRVRNLVAPSLTLSRDAEQLPRSLAAGAAWTRPLAGRPLLLSGEAGLGGGEAPLGLGVEVPVAAEVLVRAGFRGSSFRAGAGFAAAFLSVDYGVEMHALGLVHGVSVTARMGQGADELEAERRAAAEAERAAAIAAASAAAGERAIAAAVDSLRLKARSGPDRESARASWLALRGHRPGDPEARAALDSLAAHEAQETAAWRDSLQSREQGLRAALLRLMSAADSLVVARRDLESRESLIAAQRAELRRLGLLRRAADAFAAGEMVQAAAIADSLAAAYPGDPEVAALRARLAPGVDLLDPAHRDQARRLYIEGMRRFNAGDYEGAIRYWEELLALDPGNRAVRLNLDEARARLGAVR